MTTSRSRLALVVVALALGACSGTATTATGTPVTGGGASATTTTPAPTATPVATAASSPSGSHAVGPLPSDFDPCTLLTTDQATAINGLSYGPGTAHALRNGLVECVWGHASPPGSITVQVLVAPSADEASTAFANAQADLRGFGPHPVTGFFKPPQTADEQADIAQAPAGTVSTGGIYVQDGAVYFDVVYLGGAAPSDGQLTVAALLVLGALP